MAQRGRPGLSPDQKRELWRRWKEGESLSEIGRALGRQAGSIHGVVAANGGYVPPLRRRSSRVLSLAEREEISRGRASCLCLLAIAPSPAPSTVDDQPRDRAPRRRCPVPGDPGRRAGLAAGPEAETVQARDVAGAARAGRRQARPRVVAGADLGLACPDVPGRARSPGVDRDDLSQPVHPVARRAAQGADGAARRGSGASCTAST